MELYSYEEKHTAIMRSVAPECMVLLKSKGDFPIESPGDIAIYGSGARQTLKGGTGSGDVNSRFYVTVEEGLEKAGFRITTKEWLDAYDRVRKQAHEEFVKGIKEKAKALKMPAVFVGMGAVMPEPEYEIPLGSGADVALYILARVSGEGSDRNPIKGDIKLTDREVKDILELNRRYSHFMLVLNVGGVVDLSPVMDVGNILLLSQLGVATGDALTDVILGKAYPSGKLTATWTAWEDYCQVGEFGNEDDTRYVEGIYVGYRYFDSIGKEVLFPFGHGLHYTDFVLKEPELRLEGTKVCGTVRVSNTGSRKGKEVVQVYVSIPSGSLDQPYQVLADFAKTGELAPGESRTVEVSFDMSQLASFDTERACRILEAGNYIIRIGNSSRNRMACAVVKLDKEVVVQELSNLCGTPDFADWKPENPAFPIEYDDLPVLELAAEEFVQAASLEHQVSAQALDKVRTLSDNDLVYLCCGNYRSEEEGKSAVGNGVIGNAGIKVPGAAGETTDRLEGIPCLVMADGPAGLRLNRQYGVDEQGIYPIGDTIPAAFVDFLDEDVLKIFGMEGIAEDNKHRNGRIVEQYCTAIPIGTALAQSWNEDICELCGDVVGEEMERFGVHLWLAPAFNIQRNPLCGRNFEYCSEDPLISGRISAAITRGVQDHPGRGVTIKHFCCNNQETNRYRTNSAVSQRALRDIYLKGFEICVREAKPATLMTSYNLLNGRHTSECRDLIQGILRREWGFEGVVMTDWIAQIPSAPKKYPYASAPASIKVGNDLIMPGGKDDHDRILAAMHGENVDVKLERAEVEACAARTVELAWKLAFKRK